MTNNNNINLAQFDFNAFQENAISQLKSGQSLTGKDGVLTPLIKKFLKQPLRARWSHICLIAVSKVFPTGVMASRLRPLKVALAALSSIRRETLITGKKVYTLS